MVMSCIVTRLDVVDGCPKRIMSSQPLLIWRIQSASTALDTLFSQGLEKSCRQLLLSSLLCCVAMCNSVECHLTS